MSHLALTLFGGFTATVDGAKIATFDSNKVRALLAFLAVEADRTHRRESLATLLWPGYPAGSARTHLRNALANLRTAIHDREADPPFLWITRDTLQFNAHSSCWLDVAVVQTAAAATEQAPIEELSVAADTYTGDFLAGFALSDAVDFDDWAAATRERLLRRALDLLGATADRLAAAGDVEDALAYARRRVELAPWFEVAQRQCIRLLAAAGQRSAALRQYETCRAVLQRELGAEPSAQTQAVYQQVQLGKLPDLQEAERMLAHERHAVGPCPYRGLAPFREADAAFFFGRDAFVQQLEAALAVPPALTAVVGPSGSGKSSVVLAGLLPRLRETGRWLIATLRPGASPCHALAGALIPLLEPDLTETSRLIEGRRLTQALAGGEILLSDVVARIRQKAGSHARLLLLVDQFEELYTLCPDPQIRRGFINLLLDTVNTARHDAGSPAVLLTLRADFMGQALAHRPFADVLQHASQMLGPMTRAELRAAIEKPAAAQGAVFERGLVARLLDDVGDEPGNLPLLEFALTLLWERLDGGWVTHTAYEAIGKVEGALARYAQDVHEALPERDRALCRRVFTQLVQPGEGTEDTRRIATRADLAGPTGLVGPTGSGGPAGAGDAAWDLVRHLADRRLVVTGRDELSGTETVEVIHEALIRHWDQLQTWMAEDRTFRTWQERMRVSVRTWEATDRDEGALLRGVPLAEAEEWLRTRAQDLSETDRAFVEAGISLRAAQRQRELDAAQQLAEAHDHARRQAAIGLAAEARNQAQGPGQDVAVLLALEAVEHYPYTWQAERALAEVVLNWRLVMQFAHSVSIYSPAVISPDGTRLLTSTTYGELRVCDLRSGEPLLAVQGYQRMEGDHLHAWWSPSGERILTATGLGRARIWDAETGELMVDLAEGGWAEWSPDGTRVLTAGSGQQGAAVWDARTGQPIHSLRGDRGGVWTSRFSPDGKWIATSLGQVWDADTGELVHTLAAYQDLITWDDQPRFSWSPDGTKLGTGMAGTARVWDAATGAVVLALHTGYQGKADLWWSPDGERLLTTTSSVGDTPATLWNARTGERLRGLPFYDGLPSLTDPWSPTGDRILLADSQGGIGIWEADSGRELLKLAAHDGNAYANWLPDGGGFVSTALDGKARVWRISPADLDVDGQHECPGYVFDGFSVPIWSPEGTQVGRSFADGTVRIWDVAAGVQVLRFQTLGNDALPSRANCLAWSPDGKRIVTGTEDGKIDIWDSTSGKPLLALPEQNEVAVGVHWSPEGRRVLTCVRLRSAVVWDASTGEALTEFIGQSFCLGAWSPDGTRIALADVFGGSWSVRVWAAATGEALLTLLADDFPHGSGAVAWSPDGARIVTFSRDRVGRMWDAETGAQLGAFHAPWDCMIAEWSPSGERFLVGSLSGVHVWDAASLQKIITYPAGDKLWGSWSPDGTAIALAYANQDLKVFPAWQSLEELVAYAKEHCVLRDLTPEERTQFGLPER